MLGITTRLFYAVILLWVLLPHINMLTPYLAACLTNVGNIQGSIPKDLTQHGKFNATVLDLKCVCYLLRSSRYSCYTLFWVNFTQFTEFTFELETFLSIAAKAFDIKGFFHQSKNQLSNSLWMLTSKLEKVYWMNSLQWLCRTICVAKIQYH